MCRPKVTFFYCYNAVHFNPVCKYHNPNAASILFFRIEHHPVSEWECCKKCPWGNCALCPDSARNNATQDVIGDDDRTTLCASCTALAAASSEATVEVSEGVGDTTVIVAEAKP